MASKGSALVKTVPIVGNILKSEWSSYVYYKSLSFNGSLLKPSPNA